MLIEAPVGKMGLTQQNILNLSTGLFFLQKWPSFQSLGVSFRKGCLHFRDLGNKGLCKKARLTQKIIIITAKGRVMV